MQVDIKKATKTAIPGRYQLKLSCGHNKIVARLKSPTRKTIVCGVCAAAAGAQAATLEIERRERQGAR